jgi:hypothetical protein
MSLSRFESMVSRVGIEPTTSRLRVRITPVQLSCAELLPGYQSVAQSGLLGFGSSAECRSVRLSTAELSTGSQPRFRAFRGATERTTWQESLRAHWEVLAAAHFFTVKVWTVASLTRYAVFVVDLAARVEIAGPAP